MPQSEMRTMLSEIPLSRVVDTMAEGVLVLDTACHVVLWNRALEEMTGWGAEEMVGEACSKVICSSPPAPYTQDGGTGTPDCALLKHTGGQPVVLSAKCSLRTKSGGNVPVLKNGRVLIEDGKPIAAVITFTDLRPVNNLQQALAATREGLARVLPPGRLVGTSPEMREVYERVHLAAHSDATVLLLGETGTGKELVAEAIHGSSSRSDRPFIKVNCSALAESLLEGELFGHVQGAFTGAVHDKIGRFEAADGGTILLDEIGDISPMIQLKLLRILQEREFERVGESTSRKVNVRVICATHRDLRELVREGVFREDLFYRIRVFPLDLLPLRRHKSDIPLLVDAFIQRFNHQTGKRILGLGPDALHCLMDYCWPGNVRELENAVEHAFVVCQEDHIGLFDLPTEIRMVELRTAYCREHRFSKDMASDGGHSPADTRDSFLAVLRGCDWNQSETARRLGVDRSTVWRKMKRWDISPPDGQSTT
jgi:two-component system, NtrC family, response regulator HydG